MVFALRRHVRFRADPTHGGPEDRLCGAREAWGQFLRSPPCVLLLVCTSDYGYLIGRDGRQRRCADTFLRAFDGATTLIMQRPVKPTSKSAKCRKWLARIAENIVRDRYRGQPEVRLLDDDEDLEKLSRRRQMRASSQIQVPESKRLKLLKSGFALLSEIEQTVLRATMFWWQPVQEHQRMPHAAMEELSQTNWEITSEHQADSLALDGKAGEIRKRESSQ